MIQGITTSLPELIALKALVTPSKIRALQRAYPQTGQHASRYLGRGMDFSETRNYQSGDDIRHMEWRVTARTGRPHVKVYTEERERPILLWVNFSPSMYFGTRVAFKSVIAARLAALIAWTVVQQGDRIGGLLFSNHCHHELQPKSHQRAILPLLSHLADYTKCYDLFKNSRNQDSSFSLQDFLKLRRVVKPGSTIVLLSDFYGLNDLHLSHLRHLTQHNQLISYQICDPLEYETPKPASVVFSDGSDFIKINTGLHTTQSYYQEMCQNHTQLVNETLKKQGILSHLLQTTDELLPIVLRTFIRRHYG